MKIIGKTANGLIVETTESEIINALGFSSVYNEDWKKFRDKAREAFESNGQFKLGATVNVALAHGFFSNLQYKEKQARDAAGMLHSLAEMITHALPTIIVAPDTDWEREQRSVPRE